MRHRMLNGAARRTIVAVFETGDEVMEGLEELARAERLTTCHLTAMGALQDLTLGFFDAEQRSYLRNHISQQVEVLSLTGNVVRHEGQATVRAHVVVGRHDGMALGGHLLQAHVRPSLEVVLVEEPEYLQRMLDESTGLPLIRIAS